MDWILWFVIRFDWVLQLGFQILLSSTSDNTGSSLRQLLFWWLLSLNPRHSWTSISFHICNFVWGTKVWETFWPFASRPVEIFNLHVSNMCYTTLHICPQLIYNIGNPSSPDVVWTRWSPFLHYYCFLISYRNLNNELLDSHSDPLSYRGCDPPQTSLQEIVKQVADWLAIIHNRNEPNLAGLRLLGRKVKFSKISLFTTDFHECIECYQTTQERIMGFSITQIH
jgi:hypothetical protein